MFDETPVNLAIQFLFPYRSGSATGNHKSLFGPQVAGVFLRYMCYEGKKPEIILDLGFISKKGLRVCGKGKLNKLKLIMK